MTDSQTTLPYTNDLLQKLFRVKKGDVDSCHLVKVTLCVKLCGLTIKNVLGKKVFEQKRTPHANRERMDDRIGTVSCYQDACPASRDEADCM